MGTDGIVKYDKKSNTVTVEGIGGTPGENTFTLAGNAKLFFEGLAKQTGMNEFSALVQFADLPVQGVAVRQFTISYRGDGYKKMEYAFQPDAMKSVSTVHRMKENEFTVNLDKNAMSEAQVQKMFAMPAEQKKNAAGMLKN